MIIRQEYAVHFLSALCFVILHLDTGGNLSLSRFNHRLPGGEAHPEVVQGTAEFHHEIADALLPEADPVFDDATTLHTTIDMLDPQPTLVQRLVRHMLLQRELCAAWLLGWHKPTVCLDV